MWGQRVVSWCFGGRTTWVHEVVGLELVGRVGLRVGMHGVSFTQKLMLLPGYVLVLVLMVVLVLKWV